MPYPTLSFLFFFYCSGAHRDLHSFPTRRSSDLRPSTTAPPPSSPPARTPGTASASPPATASPPSRSWPPRGGEAVARSEEHTSELQSRLHLVCRLLLEKKKKNKNETMLTKSAPQ